MLDRVARLPEAPCLLARGTRLGGVAFYHVNGSCRAIPANRGEINRENMAARGEFFRSYHLPVLCAEQNDSKSEEINVIDESQTENRPVHLRYGEAVVRREIVKITSGDVMTRVPLRLSRRSLAFYYGKVPSFTYSSLREYKPAVYFSF